MPTYDYLCGACQYKFEEFQSIKAPSLRKCPKCGKNKLKRLIGIGAGVIFKGSGFYETDYRSDSYKKAESDEKKSSEAPKTETKGESKVEAPKSDGGKSDGNKPQNKPEGTGKSENTSKPEPKAEAPKPAEKPKSEPKGESKPPKSKK